MEKPKFVYVTYIRTTPEALWNALTQPEFTRQFFVGTWQDCAWKEGASWQMTTPDGRPCVSGEVLKIDPPWRLVLTWREELKPELRSEGFTRVSYDLEPQDNMVKLTIVHESDVPAPRTLASVSQGWPLILASLKSFLETGKPLEATSRWPEDDRCVSTSQNRKIS